MANPALEEKETFQEIELVITLRDIVDHFKGKIWTESEGQDTGTTILCELSVHKQKLKSYVRR